MKLLLFYVCLLISSLSRISFAGGAVGNGGDAVYCIPSSSNVFSGYYSLDYLAQFQRQLKPAPVSSLDESLERIERGIERNIPELLSSFQEFRQQIFNEQDSSKKYLWEPAQFGLVDLKDESLVSLLPPNCLKDGKVMIVQAVIRVSEYYSGRPIGKYLFRYVPDVINKLGESNPTQLSFLLVHEWLWNFSDKVDRNRRLNYWLHSENLENWSQAQWSDNLNGIGFTIPGTEEDLYSPQLCLPDEEAMDELFAKAKTLNAKGYILGYGKAAEHGKLCRVADGLCNNSFREGGPRTTFGSNLFDFKDSITVELRSDRLVVRSRLSGEHAVTHFSCVLNKSNKSIDRCSNLVLSSGYEHQPFLNFIPVIGKNCIRFSEQKFIPTDKTEQFMNLMEYVLLFRAPQY